MSQRSATFAEQVENAARVLAAAADAFGLACGLRPGDWADAESLQEALAAAESDLRSWLLEHPHDLGRATLLVNEIQQARLAAHSHELERRRAAVTTVGQVLHQLRSASTVAELATRVPHEGAKLGFNRVLFSWLENRCWVPVSFHTETGPDEARAVMAAGTDQFQPVGPLLEGEMLRARRPMLVRNALDHPRVHPGIQAIMHSHAYVAAPVVTSSGVVGFLNADQNSETGTVDDYDRDVVAMFCEGVGLALERVTMLEEMAQVRSRLSQQADALRGLMSELDGDHAVAAPPTRGPTRSRTRFRDLTRREEEVLELVASGLSNADIADRLYISEGTAKTHVKNVLHKLGVENRIQAGALYRQERQI
ncbi:LuxR C-terminal-related transcriptional regulator [Nocardioides sp. YJ-D4]